MIAKCSPAFWECPSPMGFTCCKVQDKGKIYREPNLCRSPGGPRWINPHIRIREKAPKSISMAILGSKNYRFEVRDLDLVYEMTFIYLNIYKQYKWVLVFLPWSQCGVNLPWPVGIGMRGLSCLLLNSGVGTNPSKFCRRQIDGYKVPSKYTYRFSPQLLYDKELLY